MLHDSKGLKIFLVAVFLVAIVLIDWWALKSPETAGGYGGVGIETSILTRYFAIHAGADPRGPEAIEELYHTLARDDPVVVTFGEVEKR